MSIAEPDGGGDADSSQTYGYPQLRLAENRPTLDPQTAPRIEKSQSSALWRFFFPDLPPIDPNARGTIPSLDGIRAISILIVAISHAGLGWLVPGGFGVTIFFFLSGYLITTLMRKESTKTGTVALGKFYIRRSLRILPPCYIVVGALLVVDLALGVAFSWYGVLSHVLYYTNYYKMLGSGPLLSGLGVLWSLAVEEHFYLIFPLLYLASLRLPRPAQGTLLAGICLLVLAWRCLLVLQFHAPVERVFEATDTRLDSILWGCCFAILANPALGDRHSRWISHWSLTVVAIGVIFFSLLAFRQPWFRETFRYSLQSIALIPIFAGAVRWFDRGPYLLLNTYFMRLLGAYSYTIYLTHYSIFLGLKALHLDRFPIAFPVMMVLSFVAAAIMYQIVDLPCARLRKRFGA